MIKTVDIPIGMNVKLEDCIGRHHTIDDDSYFFRYEYEGVDNSRSDAYNVQYEGLMRGVQEPLNHKKIRVISCRIFKKQ